MSDTACIPYVHLCNGCLRGEAPASCYPNNSLVSQKVHRQAVQLEAYIDGDSSVPVIRLKVSGLPYVLATIMCRQSDWRRGRQRGRETPTTSKRQTWDQHREAPSYSQRNTHDRPNNGPTSCITQVPCAILTQHYSLSLCGLYHRSVTVHPNLFHHHRASRPVSETRLALLKPET